jgi:hypothetical protein
VKFGYSHFEKPAVSLAVETNMACAGFHSVRS